MSKSASTSSAYRVTELIGTSESSWEGLRVKRVDTGRKVEQRRKAASHLMKPLRNTIRRCPILYADRNGF